MRQCFDCIKGRSQCSTRLATKTEKRNSIIAIGGDEFEVLFGLLLMNLGLHLRSLPHEQRIHTLQYIWVLRNHWVAHSTDSVHLLFLCENLRYLFQPRFCLFRHRKSSLRKLLKLVLKQFPYKAKDVRYKCLTDTSAVGALITIGGNGLSSLQIPSSGVWRSNQIAHSGEIYLQIATYLIENSSSSAH